MKMDELINSVEFMGKQYDGFSIKLDSLLGKKKNFEVEN